MSNPYVIGVLMRVEERVGESYLDKRLAGSLNVEIRILNDDEIYGVGTQKFEVVTKVFAETNVLLEELSDSQFLEDMLKANGNNEGVYYLYLMNMAISDKALEYEYTTEVEQTEEEVEEHYRIQQNDSEEIDIDDMSEMYSESSGTTREVDKRLKAVVIEDYNIIDNIMDSLMNNDLLDLLEDEELKLLTFELLEVRY